MFEKQLDSVHYKSPPWSTHYPELVKIFQARVHVHIFYANELGRVHTKSVDSLPSLFIN